MTKPLLTATLLALTLLSTVIEAAPGRRAASSLPWLRAAGTKIVNDRGQTVRLKGLFLPNNTWGNWVWPISAQLEKQGKDPMIKPREQDAWVLTDSSCAIGGNQNDALAGLLVLTAMTIVALGRRRRN